MHTKRKFKQGLLKFYTNKLNETLLDMGIKQRRFPDFSTDKLGLSHTDSIVLIYCLKCVNCHVLSFDFQGDLRANQDGAFVIFV